MPLSPARSLSVSSVEDFLSQIEPSIKQPRNLSGLEWVEGIGDEISGHLYKIIFFLLYVFFYIIMYILNIAKTTKRCQLMKSKTLSLKTYIKELGFLKKRVIIQWNARKKRFIVACKQINTEDTWSS